MRISVAKFLGTVCTGQIVVGLMASHLYANAPDCRLRMSRLTQGSEDPSGEIFSEFADTQVGLNSHRVYESKWRKDENDALLDFRFEGRRDQDHSASVKVDLRSDGKIKLDLERDNSGRYIDINFVGPALDHLFDHAKKGSSFWLEIDDPIVVDRLNEQLGRLLDAMAWKSDYPRRASPSASSNPYSSQFDYDSNSHSYFPEMDSQLADETMPALKVDMDLSKALVNQLMKTHFKDIFEYASRRGWKLNIDIQGFSLHDDLGLRFEEDEFGVHPYVYTFVLSLTR